MTVTGSPQDEEAIGEVLIRLAHAFAGLSADGVADLYTADADWTNAFGTSRTGGKQIEAYLADLFADRHFAAAARSGRRAPTSGSSPRTSPR